jgi:hypothetical protein
MLQSLDHDRVMMREGLLLSHLIGLKEKKYFLLFETVGIHLHAEQLKKKYQIPVNMFDSR